MAINLYYWPKSSSNRVWWALEELGVPYEKIKLDREKGDQKKPEYLAINPNGLVPGLQDDGVNMFESLAMMIHLGEKYGVDKGLWPKPGSAESAEALTWACWGSVTLDPPTITNALHDSDAHYALPKEKRNAEIAAAAKKEIQTRMAILDKRLEGREYMLGDKFTLLDACMVPSVARCVMCKVDMSAYKNVMAWFQRATSRPKFKEIIAAT